jgi:hypothetical protein
MSRIDRRLPLRNVWTCLAVAVLVVAACGVPALAQDGAFQRHLQAGEFAPAAALAQQAPAPQRDALLQQVAVAKAAAGMRQGALQTAAQIDSDSLRSQAVAGIASTPLGNFGPLPGAPGGGSMADFDSLINLIKTTVSPDSWDDVGGPGSIAPFQGGVRVDADGVVHTLLREARDGQLASLRRAAAHVAYDADVRRTSGLRKVSLTRLEREVQLRLAAGEPLNEDMLVLAGLQRVQYVFVYPETGDIVLAGPAGDWRTDAEGRLVSVESGRPVLRLDDLVVLLRHFGRGNQTAFGCSITPLQENLARTRAFIVESSKRPLPPGGRSRWLQDLAEHLGLQAIEFFGIDPQTRVARVLFEADYRMKLVGIGLEAGTVGVPSYLSMLVVKPGEPAPPLGVVRWWFTLNYEALRTTESRDAYELCGQGVKVLSENELLTETGMRIHTGQSDANTATFAQNFTEHFPALAARYPVYAELQNIFDLALVCCLLRHEDVGARVGWHMSCFGDPAAFAVELGFAPRHVPTVVNHRIVNRTQILAVASGGVHADFGPLVKASALQIDRRGMLGSYRHAAAPEKVARQSWWWD